MIPGPDWLIVYEDGWNGHEEHYATTLWETLAGEFYLHETRHNVYTGSHDSWSQLTETQAIEFLIEAEDW